METRAQLTKSIQMYDPFTEAWREIPTIGTPPQGLYDGAATYSDHFLYTYGGYDGTSYSSSLHQLDTRSYTWTQLSSQHEHGPMRMIGCGIIYYNNSLVICGGFGFPSGEIQAGSQFIKHSKFKDGIGWTNEIHMFNISEGTKLSYALFPYVKDIHDITYSYEAYKITIKFLFKIGILFEWHYFEILHHLQLILKL